MSLLTDQYRKKFYRKSAGFTLIEVLITIVVVSIGLLGLAGLQINSLRANMGSEDRSKASYIASDIAERMRANPLGVHNNNPDLDNQYANITTDGQNCDNLPAPFCSNFNNGTATQAADCDPDEMAIFDAWVWACGMPKANNVVPGGLTNNLSGGTGSVTCNDVDLTDDDNCSPGSPHTITVNWTEQAAFRGDNDENAVDQLTQTYTLVVVP